MKIVPLICLILFVGFVLPAIASAQSQPQTQRVTQLEDRVNTLEGRIAKLGNDQGLALILFAVVCALWAQNTGRSGWLWFFLGLFFSIITVLVLLWKNSRDIDRRRRGPTRAT